MRGPWAPGRSDRGYLLVWVSASMVVLLGVTGFAVDFGYWFHRAAEMQSAADAGALAGVVYMPADFDQASAVAGDAVARNGVGAGASVSRVAGNSRRLNVCVSDNDVKAFFASIFDVHPKIRRCATAEYVLPVALGSPLNILDDEGTSLGVHPMINGWCTAKEEGDLLSARYRGTRDDADSVNTKCPPPPGDLNSDYSADGYYYVVELPAPAANAVVVEVRHGSYHHPGKNVQGGTDQWLGTAIEPNEVTTTFTVYDATETPLDTTDDPQVAQKTYPTVGEDVPVHPNDGWTTLFTIPAQAVGRYRIQVRTEAGEPGSIGTNGFGLRARHTSGAFGQCTTVPGDPGYLSWCPQVSAETAMALYASKPGGTAEFYLAQVDAVHAGKEMVITLFDPGEGGKAIEVLDPNGDPVSFDWATVDDLSPGHSGTTASLDVSGAASPRLQNRASDKRFNERKLELRIDLPGNYATAYGGDTWWKLRYTFDGAVNDKTTWSVWIDRNPLRLVPNP